MKFQVSDLWRWEGTIGRGAYFAVGIIGFALKHNLDRFVATGVFNRPWGVFNYWIPLEEAANLGGLSLADSLFLSVMLVLSFPFIWVGVVLTVKRLRSAELPTWLVMLFFAPFINLVFFLLLSVIPEWKEKERPGAELEQNTLNILDRWILDSPWGAALLSVGLSSVVWLVFTWLSVELFGLYGWTLFVGTPFCQGLMAVLFYGYHQKRGYGKCLLVAITTQLLVGAALFALVMEGLICLIMAAPLGLVLAGLGGSIGYVMQSRRWSQMEAPATVALLLLLTPGLLAAEYVIGPERPLFKAVTVMEMDAPPEVVWENVIGFAEIPDPEGWLFQLGVSYPIRAEIQGEGVGAVRYCVFSTGAFVEPIEVWDAPWRLKFSVTKNPPPMAEWNPLKEIHPPHLEGYLVSKGGQFLLTPLAGGRTRVEATTWYHHSMWPAAYWRIWSDGIIHRIHTRVLKHIKSNAEGETPAITEG